jgi:KaiC/GvpD/RAD55 family RecA-like ATPase
MDSRYGVEEFVTDGLIVLDMSILGDEAKRSLQISKMRETDINAGNYSFVFTEDGIQIV